MDDLLYFLGIALVCLGIGGCVYLCEMGEAAKTKAKAEAELILRQGK